MPLFLACRWTASVTSRISCPPSSAWHAQHLDPPLAPSASFLPPSPALPASKPCSYLYAKSTGTKRCSLCYAETKNAGMAVFKVRLCPLCTASSILNKSAATEAFSLSPADLSKLAQWTDPSQTYAIGSNVIHVTMFFVRDLERAAYRKYGGRAGFEAHRAARSSKQEARKAVKDSSLAVVKKELKVGRGPFFWGAGGLSWTHRAGIEGRGPLF